MLTTGVTLPSPAVQADVEIVELNAMVWHCHFVLWIPPSVVVTELNDTIAEVTNGVVILHNIMLRPQITCPPWDSMPSGDHFDTQSHAVSKHMPVASAWV